MWTRTQAVRFIKRLQSRVGGEKCNCNVALTGGLLYKGNNRKDLDIVVYRHKSTRPVDLELFWRHAVNEFNLRGIESYGRIVKALYKGHAVDFFFVEDPNPNNNARYCEYDEADEAARLFGIEARAELRERRREKREARKPWNPINDDAPF